MIDVAIGASTWRLSDPVQASDLTWTAKAILVDNHNIAHNFLYGSGPTPEDAGADAARRIYLNFAKFGSPDSG